MQWVYVTASNRDEALSVARACVEARLAACANVLDGATSVYWWDGAVREGPETVLIMKTRRDLVDALTEKVRAVHGYSCPCVVSLDIDNGNPAFLQWIGEETR
ncbi:MAG: divalent-cation tolerance protein CutA [Alphaproteobacteria bacterium]|nr:divalent-cation tolerance protein CutA [Alphaproteobacteria bacterium]MBF0249069.1 divalent-cation tolerance protein CutA [Alphaproteobacteria bacterium]